MKIESDVEEVIEGMKLPFELVPLQKEDALSAVRSGRFGLFYAVGGGKTVVSTVVSKLWEDDHTLVVCPPILLPQWEEWLHTCQELDTSIFAGPKRTTGMLNHRWVIMSHAIFRDSFITILQQFKGKTVNVLLDEAQSIKNPKSKLYKCILQFVAPDRNLLMLTATPTSKPQDTYTYMKLKTPTVYRSMGHWTNVHVDKVDIFGAITAYKNLDMLAENFSLKAVARTKRDLFGDNLDPIFQPMQYDLAPAHLKLYHKLAEEQLLLLDNGEKIDATSAQRLRHALQQIVLNYARFSGRETDKATGLDLLDEVIEEVDPMKPGNSKLAIWTYYKNSSRLVTSYLQEKYGKQAVVAAYSEVDSAKSVKAIMNDDNCRILVGQPSSVGVGLNLHHVCSEMLFLEQATTPMQTRQAIGRVDRAGQKIKPTIRFAQARGTIQIAMFKDLLRNDDLVTQVERTPKSLRDEIFGA